MEIYIGNKSNRYKIKMPPLEVEGDLMFSQRNNPYCELLSKL
jgi:hypothetical protein